MTPTGICLLALVAFWLTASFAFQLAPFQSALGRLDYLKLLPNWSFFAPRPASRDDHLMVRYVYGGGCIGAWRSVERPENRSLREIVWNPDKRRRKIVRDAGKAVRHMAMQGHSGAGVHCSMSYLLLLHHVIRTGHAPEDAQAVQFALIETSGRESRRLWIRYISGLHRL